MEMIPFKTSDYSGVTFKEILVKQCSVERESFFG